jgi:hypothetical protein
MMQLKARWVLLGVMTVGIGGAMLPIIGRYDNRLLRTDHLQVIAVGDSYNKCNQPARRSATRRKCREMRDVVLRDPAGGTTRTSVTSACLARRADLLRPGEIVPADLYLHKAFGRSWTRYDQHKVDRDICGNASPERLSIARWMMRLDVQDRDPLCRTGAQPRDGQHCRAVIRRYAGSYYDQVMPNRVLPATLPFPSPGFMSLAAVDWTREYHQDPDPGKPASADVAFVDDTGTPEDKVVHLRRLDETSYADEGPTTVYVPAGTTVIGRLIGGSRYAVTAMAGSAWKGEGVHFGKDGVSVDMGRMQVAADGSTRIGLGVDDDAPPKVIPNERF